MNFMVYAAIFVITLAVIYLTQADSNFYYLPYTFLVLVLLKVIANPKLSIFLKFLIGLFLLGNWLKITIHGIFDYPYVEATGKFAGTTAQWDSYFEYSITISVALVVAALLSIIAPRTQRSGDGVLMQKTQNSTFFLLSVFLILLIYALNWKFGFYRIGVARDLNLPFGLNAPASFMVYLGAPMLTAILATNSVIKRKSVTKLAILGVAIVSLLAAVVTYSRASVAVVMLPIILGMYRTSHDINGKWQSISGMVVIVVPTIIVTLASVSIVRIFVFGGAETISRYAVDLYIIESLGLFLDRWIGAEGLMVSVSSHQSVNLFIDMVIESPSVGVQGIYQNLAGSQYLTLNLSNMTFLTLPGAFALLTFSGSLGVVFLGVLAISTLGMLVEQLAIKQFRNQHALHYLISGSLAYHFSQMIFPLLLFPFVVQVLFFLTLFKLFQSWPARVFVAPRA